MMLANNYANISGVVLLDVTPETIVDAIKHAKNINFIDNLRNRAPVTAFDSKIRGYIGEESLKKWFEFNRVKVVSTDEYQGTVKPDVDMTIRGMARDFTIEIKTSAEPDSWENSVSKRVLLQDCISNGDMKLFMKRKGQPDIEHDLINDIYIQIYFGIRTKEHDQLLIRDFGNSNDFLRLDINHLIEKMNLYQYIENTFFVCWISRKQAITLHNNCVNNQGGFYALGNKRDAYYCPLSKCYTPQTLIQCLKM